MERAPAARHGVFPHFLVAAGRRGPDRGEGRENGGMISTDLALALRDAGLTWHPRSGDRFQLDEPEFEADVFTVSEMTIEPREYPTGRILAFNGTTEWALDSVALEDALWLPHESQLRELLGRSFRALRRLSDAFEVEVDVEGRTRVFEHPEPADAYALALLEQLRRRD